MPKKDSYTLRERNRTIKKRFNQLRQSGVPAMQAYAQLAKELYLSERQVRKIAKKSGVWP